MMVDYDLRRRLEAAAAGRKAEAGPDAPNLPADALAALIRLWEIEEMVTELFSVKPQNFTDEKGGYFHPSATTMEKSKQRLDLGRKLGAALNVQGFAKGE